MGRSSGGGTRIAPSRPWWTCGTAILIFCLAFLLSGDILPRFFSTQCTSQQGMCTPGQCDCVAPRMKRELVTQDSVACFQCVDEFCPAVAEGDLSCTHQACECEDPSWPRKDVGAEDGGSCWQCVHPSLDLTLRPGGTLSHVRCFAAASTAAVGVEQRLVSIDWNSSECITFRYNGETLANKHDNGTCLTWVPFGSYWSLAPCDGSGTNSRFKQHTLEVSQDAGLDIEEVLDSMPDAESEDALPEELFCTGTSKEELCVEPSEYMCTTDSSQCSVGHCRCEDPSMRKRELKTLNGSVCYTCSLPTVACPVSSNSNDQCLPACECTDRNHIKVQHGNGPCFSCRLPTSSSTTDMIATFAIFVLCIFTGVAVGGSLKRLWMAPVRKSRRFSPSSGNWSERWAESLEDIVEALYAVFVEQPTAALSWTRRPLRRAGRAVVVLLDLLDEALDPVYSFVERAQAAWTAYKTHKSRSEREVMRRERASVKAATRAAATPPPAAPASAAPVVPTVAPKAEIDTAVLVQPATAPCPAEPVASASSSRTEAGTEACTEADSEGANLTDLDWDPLNFCGSSATSVSPAVTIPQEWMMRLVQPNVGRVMQRAAPPAAATHTAALPAMQRRALRRLQQRREAAAVAAAAPPAPAAEAVVDDSWIDELEQNSRREKEAREAKAAQKKERKNARSRKSKQSPVADRADEAKTAADAASVEAETFGSEAVAENQEAEEDESIDPTGSVDDSSAAAVTQESEQPAENDDGADQAASSQHVEELLRAVGGVGLSGEAEVDVLLSEAMHGLFLLVSENTTESNEVGTGAPDGTDGADSGGDRQISSASTATVDTKPATGTEQPEAGGRVSKESTECRPVAAASTTHRQPPPSSAQPAQQPASRDTGRGEKSAATTKAAEAGDKKPSGAAKREKEERPPKQAAGATKPKNTTPEGKSGQSAPVAAGTQQRRKNTTPESRSPPVPEQSAPAAAEHCASTGAEQRQKNTTPKARSTPVPEQPTAPLAAEHRAAGAEQRQKNTAPQARSTPVPEHSTSASAEHGASTGAEQRQKNTAPEARSTPSPEQSTPRVATEHRASARAEQQQKKTAPEARSTPAPEQSAPAATEHRASTGAEQRPKNTAPQARSTPAPEQSTPVAAEHAASTAAEQRKDTAPEVRSTPAHEPTTAATEHRASTATEQRQRQAQERQPDAGRRGGARQPQGQQSVQARAAPTGAAPTTAPKRPTEAPWARQTQQQARPQPEKDRPQPGKETGSEDHSQPDRPAEVLAVDAGKQASPTEKIASSKPLAADARDFVPLSMMKSPQDLKILGFQSLQGLAMPDKVVTPRASPRKPGKPLTADAPDFVPLSMMQRNEEPAAALSAAASPRSSVFQTNTPRRGRRGRQGSGAEESQASLAGEERGSQSLPITTVMISGIQGHNAESFRTQLDAWGLMGTYNFYYMPSDRSGHMGAGYAFVNFIDPTFASLCQMLFQQYQFEGAATPFHVQGLEDNIAHWNQYITPGDVNAPLIIPTPTPSQWAVNGVNTMLNSKFLPQIREQFLKTKLCVFNKKNKCALGVSCPFAHNRSELQPVPDLAKTKLCYNFFRRRCNDSKCKYAHGYQELRATNNVYKTELCRWWSYGGCKAGSACRYAHGVEELRRSAFDGSSAVPMEGTPFLPPPEYSQATEAAEMTDFTEVVAEAADSDHASPRVFIKPQDHSESAAMPAYMGIEAVGGVDCGLESHSTATQSSRALESSSSSTHQRLSQEGKLDWKPLPGQVTSDSLDDGNSEMGLSEASTFLSTMDQKLRRQQTAPPTSISELPALDGGNNNIVLRVKGTFMEALHIDTEPPLVPFHRSWSDGDLPQLCEVMECMEDYTDEV